MRRPSVLFLNRVYPPVRGATGRVLRDLAQAMVRDGWDVTVIATGPRAERGFEGGVQLIRLKGPDKPRGLSGYAWMWVKILMVALRQKRPDLIVSLSDPPMAAVMGDLLKKIKKTRHIHWCHDVYPDLLPVLGHRFPGFVMRLLKKHARRALRNADKIIVIGRCMAAYLAKDGFGQKNVTLITNWPDAELANLPEETIDSHAPSFYVRGSKPHEEQLKNGPKFRVLYAGTIGRAHPLDTVVQAAEILSEEHPEIEFVFVGDGRGFAELSAERARRRLDNIRFMPYQPPESLRTVMESGDIHLISMKDEAAGMLVPSKLYSALAVSRPCVFVGPMNTETANVITEFKAGVVVAQGDAEDLAAQILNYRMNSDAWFAAHHGAEEARKVFVPEEAIKAWIKRARNIVQEDVEI